MPANTCPKCGGAVMTYTRFLREAEPYRTSSCGTCGHALRRSPAVYGLLAVMAVALVAAVAAVVLASTRGMLPGWAAATLGLLLAVFWTLLTNYLGFRLVGWVPADNA